MADYTFSADCVEQIFDLDVVPGDLEFKFSCDGEPDRVILSKTDSCVLNAKAGKIYTIVCRRLDASGNQLGAASEPAMFSAPGKAVLIPIRAKLVIK